MEMRGTTPAFRSLMFSHSTSFFCQSSSDLAGCSSYACNHLSLCPFYVLALPISTNHCQTTGRPEPLNCYQSQAGQQVAMRQSKFTNLAFFDLALEETELPGSEPRAFFIALRRKKDKFQIISSSVLAQNKTGVTILQLLSLLSTLYNHTIPVTFDTI